MTLGTTFMFLVMLVYFGIVLGSIIKMLDYDVRGVKLCQSLVMPVYLLMLMPRILFSSDFYQNETILKRLVMAPRRIVLFSRIIPTFVGIFVVCLREKPVEDHNPTSIVGKSSFPIVGVALKVFQKECFSTS